MDDFVPYQEASELKALGFDEECFGYYVTVEVRNPFLITTKISDTQGGYFTFAPIFSQAFRWFREKYGLNSHIHQENRNNYSYCCGQGYSDEIGGYQDFETYEEAELACLRKLIEIVKSKQ